MTTKKDTPIPFLLLPAMGEMPLLSIWYLGKNNFDERCPMATALSRFVAVAVAQKFKHTSSLGNNLQNQ